MAFINQTCSLKIQPSLTIVSANSIPLPITQSLNHVSITTIKLHNSVQTCNITITSTSPILLNHPAPSPRSFLSASACKLNHQGLEPNQPVTTTSSYLQSHHFNPSASTQFTTQISQAHLQIPIPMVQFQSVLHKLTQTCAHHLRWFKLSSTPRSRASNRMIEPSSLSLTEPPRSQIDHSATMKNPDQRSRADAEDVTFPPASIWFTTISELVLASFLVAMIFHAESIEIINAPPIDPGRFESDFSHRGTSS